MSNISTKDMVANIKYYMAKQGLNNNDMAELLGVCSATWSLRMRNLDNLKIKDLNKINRILKCPSPVSLLTPMTPSN